MPVASPIYRYLLNSPMLPQFVEDAGGGLTVYVQKISRQRQGTELAACTEMPFFIAMRLYWPKQEALEGTWKQPPMMPTV